MNDLDNSIKSYLILCRQKDLGAIHRIVDDLALNNSINNVAVNHNLSINSVEHTNRIFQLVGGDSMKVIADRIYAKYNAVAGNKTGSRGRSLSVPTKIPSFDSAIKGANQAKEGMEKVNKNMEEGNKKLGEINNEAKKTVDNLKQLGTTLGLGKAGETISNHLFKKTPSTAPTVESLQKENNELKEQLKECNKKLESKTT